MTADDEHREQVLLDAMAEYDEALARGVPTDQIGTTIPLSDPELAAAWNSVKQCLNLLDQARQRRTELAQTHADRPDAGAEKKQRAIGRFVLERELGRGGLGIVYLANDPKLHRQVALKIPKLEAFFDTELRRRFLREAKFAAQLNHPNLTILYEAGEDDTCCYLATEYCPGPTLAEWMQNFKRGVPVREAAAIIMAVAKGVEHAHARWILHRDIKPNNVLMSGDCKPHEGESDWVPKLTDFGVAKFLQHHSSSDTHAGLVIGTLAYMAPEQLTGRGAELDARTDLYGLGTTLYELLTGSPPYGGITDIEKLRGLITTAPTAPRALRPEIPADLEAIVLKCMAKDRRQRYSTAGELVADLQRFLDGRPTLARPTGSYGAITKWLRRQPILAAIAAVALVMATLLVVLFIAHRNRIQRSESQIASLETRAEQGQVFASRLSYISQIQKARQAWRNGDLVQMRKILDAYNDGSPNAALRQFEWYHLNYLANLPHLTLKGHVGEVYDVVFSPDGRTILSGGQDGTVRLWDAETGASLAVLKEHASCVNSIRFSADGDTFVTCSCDKTIKLWSLRERRVLSILEGHTQEVDLCDFVDDGKSIVSLSRCTNAAREIRMWDVATGEMRTDWPPKGKYDALTAAHLGHTILIYTDNRAAVWTKANAKWRKATTTGHLQASTNAIISADERFLLIPQYPNVLETRRLRDGTVISEISEHADSVNGAALSPSATKIATASSDSAVRIFDFATGHMDHCFLGHQQRVWQVAWSPNEEQVASAGSDGTVRVWNLRYGGEFIHFQTPASESKNGMPFDMAFLKDGQYVDAVYANGDDILWDLKSPQAVPIVRVANDPPATGFAENGRFANAAYSRLSHWDPAATFTAPHLHRDSAGVPDYASCARVITSEQRILEVRDDKLIVWDLPKRTKLEERQLLPSQRLRTYLNIAPDGRSCCGLREMRFFVCSLDEERSQEIPDRGNAKWAQFSPDSRKILIDTGSVYEHDAQSPGLIREYPVVRPAAGCYSSDGQRIAIESDLGFMACFDTVTGQEVLRCDSAGEPHFSADGRSLVAKDRTDGGLNYWPGRAK